MSVLESIDAGAYRLNTSTYSILAHERPHVINSSEFELLAECANADYDVLALPQGTMAIFFMFNWLLQDPSL